MLWNVWYLTGMKSGKILANFPLSMYYYVTSLCRQEECIHLLGKPFCFSLPCQLGSPMKRKNLLSVDFWGGKNCLLWKKKWQKICFVYPFLYVSSFRFWDQSYYGLQCNWKIYAHPVWPLMPLDSCWCSLRLIVGFILA